MTEADGMTFEIVTRELTEQGDDRWLHNRPLTESDFIVTRTPYVVPNGKWVMKGVSGELGYHQHFVGDPTKIDHIELESHGGVRDVIWISDESFGMLSWNKSDDTWLPTGGIRFESAKQVHKGQLGQLVPIPKLKYVREDKPEVWAYAKGKRKNRSHIGWGQASDLLAESGLTFTEIVQRFWPFVDFRSQPEDRFPPTLKMLFGVTPEHIKARRRSVLRYSKEQILAILKDNPNALDSAWIPEGLIKTILRLLALGYKPVATTYA
jgi:hypothetical protein